MGHLGPKIAHSHNSGSAVRIVLTFCTIKGIKRDMEIALGNHISGFSEKKKKKKKKIIWGNMAHRHNFGSALSFFSILQNKRPKGTWKFY